VFSTKTEKMTIEIADSIAQRAKITSQDILLRVAILLFVEEKVTIGQAAEIAGMPLFLFQKELGKRKIPIHYGMQEYKQDLKTIAKMRLA
jgi:predicted HTH domain antitoxin